MNLVDIIEKQSMNMWAGQPIKSFTKYINSRK
jgi:hypothetical protein